jgi:putative DNA primase/helicase
MTAPDMLSAALELAASGCPVFPCNPANKRPLVSGGFKSASCNPKMVAAWWHEWPDAMIGTPTGRASGVFVLDVDDPVAFAAACPDLPPTRRVKTGKGYHLHFRDEGGKVRNAQRSSSGWPFSELQGAEVRGEGGYVILPPSRHPLGSRYEWEDRRIPVCAPHSLIKIITRRGGRANSPPELRAKPIACSELRGTWEGMVELNLACRSIGLASNGEQEGTLNIAALKMGAAVARGDLERSTAAAELIAAGLAMHSYNSGDPWTLAKITAKVERGLNDGAVGGTPAAGALVRSEGAGDADSDGVSEDEVARAFSSNFKATVRFDHTIGAWFQWQGVRWQKDETRQVFQYLRELARQLGHGKKASSKASFVSGAERLADADRHHAITAVQWDVDLMLLGTPGGTVDLRTGLMRDAAPSDMITKLTSVAPEQGVPVRWLQFLDETFQGDAALIEFTQAWLGYCLTGQTKEHALAFLHGSGGNGKSVLLNTVLRILGDYAVTASMETFTASRNDKHPTDLAMLHGARLVTASETEESREFAAARVKQMTGGDPITARFMRQNFFTFNPEFKLMIAGNHAPRFRSIDPAMRRRFLLVPFLNTPAEPDKDLETKLRAEYPRILAWAIEGTAKWLREGLPRPSAIAVATEEYFKDQDIFGQWIDEYCELDAVARGRPTELFSSWSRYAQSVGVEPGTAGGMSERLKQRGFDPGKSGSNRFYRGLKVKADI